MTPIERAEKIYKEQFRGDCPHSFESECDCVEKIASEIRGAVNAAVEEALKVSDLQTVGETWTKDGKRIPPNEIYKSAQDFINEGEVAGYKRALAEYKADGLDIAYKQGLEDAARICVMGSQLGETKDPCEALERTARIIRARANKPFGISEELELLKKRDSDNPEDFKDLEAW